MTGQIPYVSRPQAEEFLNAFAAALEQPSQHPLVFNIWGIGGVGKSTLMEKLQETYKGKVAIATVDFTYWQGEVAPIGLMEKLHAALKPQFLPPPMLRRDVRRLKPDPNPFTEWYQKYFDVRHQLQTQPIQGRGNPTEDQINLVKKWLVPTAGAIGQVVVPGSGAVVSKVAEGVVETSTLVVSEVDSIKQLVQQHQAIRDKRELQELMLNPELKLTEAFVETLELWSGQRSILLLLDTYEKRLTEIDIWLWRTFLGNHPNLQACSMRLVIAGRNCLTEQEGWRKLRQDRGNLHPLQLEKFSLEQTQDYLSQIQIVQLDQTQQIQQITKGLPYYLNWVRERPANWQPSHLAKADSEIVALLLQGLNAAQKRVIQFAACCRWFNHRLIQFLLEQQGLDFIKAVDDQLDCFEWLIQKTFFVKQTSKGYQLDDVARSVFCKSLWEEDEGECFRRTHDLLARYFKAESDQRVAANNPFPAKYENPEWREARAEFLYHLLFTRRADLQTQFVTHLLEAKYFNQTELVEIPFQAVVEEMDETSQKLLPYTTSQFLSKIVPAIVSEGAILEADRFDSLQDLPSYGFTQLEIDAAIRVCLQTEVQGLAKFVSLFYQTKQCPKPERLAQLLAAKAQAEKIVTPADPEFSSGLFLWNVGNALSNLGRKEEAIESYERALEFKPDKHEAWYNRGVALSALGRKEEAIESYERALEFKPDDHEAWNNRGVALFVLGRKEEAIESYERALEFKPDKHEAWNNRGIALSDLGRKEEAIESYDKAIEIKPDYYPAWDNRGDALRKLGQYEEAVSSYSKALEINSDYRFAWHGKGLALMWLEQFDQAIESFNRALALKPDDAGILYDQSCCYGLQGNIEVALQVLQQAIDLDAEYRQMAKTDSDFDNIRDDERFQALL